MKYLKKEKIYSAENCIWPWLDLELGLFLISKKPAPQPGHRHLMLQGLGMPVSQCFSSSITIKAKIKGKYTPINH